MSKFTYQQILESEFQNFGKNCNQDLYKKIHRFSIQRISERDSIDKIKRTRQYQRDYKYVQRNQGDQESEFSQLDLDDCGTVAARFEEDVVRGNLNKSTAMRKLTVRNLKNYGLQQCSSDHNEYKVSQPKLLRKLNARAQGMDIERFENKDFLMKDIQIEQDMIRAQGAKIREEQEIIRAQGVQDYIPRFPINVDINVSEQTKDYISSLKQDFLDFTSQLGFDHIVPGMEGITSTVQSYFKNMMIGVPFILSTGILLYKYLNQKEEDSAIRTVLEIVGTFIISTLITNDELRCTLQHKFDSLLNYFNIFPQAQGQFTGVSPNFLNMLGEFITVGMYSFVAVSQKSSSKGLESILKSVGSFDRQVEGFTSMGRTLLKWAQTVINKVFEYFGVSRLQFLKTEIMEIDAWTDRVNHLLNKLESGSQTVNPKDADVVFQLVTQGNDLMCRYKQDRLMCSNIVWWKNQLDKIKAPYMLTQNVNSGFRMTPVAIMIRGEPGVGKSQVIEPLTKLLLLNILPPEERKMYLENPMKYFNSYIYNRQAETVYWDGYTQQLITIFDDFGQYVDVEGAPDNEYFNIVRAINTFPMNCHMSHLDQKGSVFFRSKVIVATSNIYNFEHNIIKSLRFPEAFTRRWDVVIDVVPKLSHCKPSESDLVNEPKRRRFDPSKASSAMDLSVYEFHLVDVNTGFVLKVMDFDECLKVVTEKYQQRENEYGERIECMADIIKQRTVAVPQGAEASKNAKVDELPQEDQWIGNWLSGKEDPFITRVQNEEKEEVEDFSNMSYEDLMKKLHEEKTMIKRAELDVQIAKVQELFDKFNVCENVALFDLCQKYGINLFFLLVLFKSSFAACTTYLAVRVLVVELCESYAQGGSVKRIVDKGMVMQEYYSNVRVSFNNCFQDFRTSLKASVVQIYDNIKEFPVLKYWKQVLSVIGVVSFACSIVFLITKFFETKAQTQGYDARVRGKLQQTRVRSQAEREQKIKVNEDKIKDQQGVNGLWKKQVSQQHTSTIENTGTFTDDIDKVVSQSGFSDHIAEQEILSIKRKNTYIIRLQENDEYGFDDISTNFFGFATFVRGRYFVVPKHFMARIQRGLMSGKYSLQDNLVLENTYNPDLRIPVQMSDYLDFKDCSPFKDRDIVIVKAPSAHPHKDITNYFINEKEIVRVKNRYCRLDVLHPNNHRTFYSEGRFIDKLVTVEDAKDVYFLRGSFHYDLETCDGDCGSLVSAIEPQMKGGRILGIHVAGSGKRGAYATVLTEQALTKALDELEKEPAIPQCNMIGRKLIEKPPIWGNFQASHQGNRVIIPRDTNIVKTKLHNAWSKCLVKPAKLCSFQGKQGEYVNPMHKALRNYAGPTVDIDSDQVVKVKDHFCHSFFPHTRNMPRTIFSFEQAVQGVPGLGFCDGLDRQKSSGYPYNTMEGYKRGKTIFFGSEGDFEFTSDQCSELREQVRISNEKAVMFERDEVVFTDFLKDETRKIAKVESGDTRLVSACPLRYLIQMRQYFMSFSIACMQSRLYNGMGVGMNCYNEDWDVLAELLQTKGKKVFAGDYSKFDSSQQPKLLWSIVDIVNDWYGDSEDNKNIRKTLWAEVVNSHHVNGDIIYEWTHSLPSGHPLTTIINSIYNHLSFRLCWLDCGLKLDDFEDNVFLVTYGDDNVVNISDRVCDVFNQNTVIKAMPKYGLTYTTERKDEEYVADYRRLQDVTFLKRGFRYEDTYLRWVSPLDMDTILQMSYWLHKNPDIGQITIDVFEKSLQELAQHGPIVFNEVYKKMKQGFHERLGLVPKHSRCSEYLDLCLSTQDTY